MISDTAKQRILKLCDYLEKLPPSAARHFDMVEWFGHKKKHKHLRDGETVEQRHLSSCGTTACALGWASTMPYFRKLGLSMVYDSSVNGGAVVRFGAMQSAHGGVFDVIREAFDLQGDEAQVFFRDLPADTPQQWAINARTWIRQQQRLEDDC